jgi:phage terminase large subunit-like protein
MPRVNRKIRVRPKDHITRPQILEMLLGPNGAGKSAFRKSAEQSDAEIATAIEAAWQQVEPKLSPGFAEQWYAASSEHHSFTTVAEQYARDVIAGIVPACKWVKRACERHLKDLDRAASGAWKYRFDTAKADRVCRFIELLPHVKGIWAANAERINLEPWQIFVVCCLFGWVKIASGLRRFTLGYLEVARKNAKSILAAAIGLYMFACDGEFGAEVYSGATTEKQAYEVFGPALRMMEKSTELAYVLGILVGAKGLKTADDKSRFEAVIGKPGDGASPHCGIVDEYHEHDDDTLYDTLSTGMGARTQPLKLVITTSGDNMAGPCKLLHDDLCEVLEGHVDRDEVFVIIYTVDSLEEWATEIGLRKSNPNMGVSVFVEYLLTEQQTALANPRKRGVFQTKNCCVWVGSVDSYFDVRQWALLGDPTLHPDQFLGQTCAVSVDLSTKRDFTARALIFKKVEKGKVHYYLFSRFYLPEAQITKPEAQKYQQWEEQKHIVQHDGAVVDFEAICEEAISVVNRYKPREFAYDDWNATQFAQAIQKNTRAQIVEIEQNAKRLSPPMKEMDTLIAEGRFHHDGNPVMTWMLGNVKAKEDANENVFPRKQEGRAENKIDGAVAAIMALARLLVAAPKRSVYATRGILSVPVSSGVGMYA